jgi:hypothetical protein
MPRLDQADIGQSILLTSIPIRADDRRRLAGRAQPEPTDLRENIERRDGPIRLDRGLNDCQQLPLQGSMVSFGPLSQPSHNVVRGILDREIDGNSSSSTPFWIPLYRGDRADGIALFVPVCHSASA